MMKYDAPCTCASPPQKKKSSTKRLTVLYHSIIRCHPRLSMSERDYGQVGLAEKFYACIDDEMQLIKLPAALIANTTVSEVVGKCIRDGDISTLETTLCKFVGDARSKLLHQYLDIFYKMLSPEDLLQWGISVTSPITRDPETARAFTTSTVAEAADSDADVKAFVVPPHAEGTRGFSAANSSCGSSLKDDFADIDFNNNTQHHHHTNSNLNKPHKSEEEGYDTPPYNPLSKPPSTNAQAGASSLPITSFIGVSLSDGVAKYAALGAPPATPLLDFYRGVTCRDFPSEGSIHVGDWVVNLPVADVDDVLLSDKLVGTLFPRIASPDEMVYPNSKKVRPGEMWWISRDAVAQGNVVELAEGFLGAVDIKVEWANNKTSAVLLVSTNAPERVQQALQTNTAISVLLQLADFLDAAGATPLAAATREFVATS